MAVERDLRVLAAPPASTWVTLKKKVTHFFAFIDGLLYFVTFYIMLSLLTFFSVPVSKSLSNAQFK
jgi:hypothetical protein